MHPLMHRLSVCFPLTKSFLRFHNTLNGMRKYDRVSNREEFEKLLKRRWEAISMAEKIKVAFICVHNSCRSQMAEALGKKYLADICDCYSAGTQTKPQINQDAVRLMKKHTELIWKNLSIPNYLRISPKQISWLLWVVMWYVHMYPIN